MIIVGLLIFAIIAVVDEQHTETVADSDTGSDNQKMVGKPSVLHSYLLIEVIVQNKHSHDNGFAGTSSHFERSTWEDVLVAVRNGFKPCVELPQNVAADIRVEVSYFIQIYSSLDSFALAEEKFLKILAFGIVEPKIQKFAGYPCGARVTRQTPILNLVTNEVDKWCVGVIALYIFIAEQSAVRLVRRHSDMGGVRSPTFKNLGVVKISA